MKRFQFRLETALRLRQLAEQQAQAALAEAERAVLAAEQALTKTLGERERHLAYYAQLQQQSKPDIALIAAHDLKLLGCNGSAGPVKTHGSQWSKKVGVSGVSQKKRFVFFLVGFGEDLRGERNVGQAAFF